MIKFYIGNEESPMLRIETNWQFIVITILSYILFTTLRGFFEAWYKDWRQNRKRNG